MKQSPVRTKNTTRNKGSTFRVLLISAAAIGITIIVVKSIVKYKLTSKLFSNEGLFSKGMSGLLGAATLTEDTLTLAGPVGSIKNIGHNTYAASQLTSGEIELPALYLLVDADTKKRLEGTVSKWAHDFVDSVTGVPTVRPTTCINYNKMKKMGTDGLLSVTSLTKVSDTFPALCINPNRGNIDTLLDIWTNKVKPTYPYLLSPNRYMGTTYHSSQPQFGDPSPLEGRTWIWDPGNMPNAVYDWFISAATYKANGWLSSQEIEAIRWYQPNAIHLV